MTRAELTDRFEAAFNDETLKQLAHHIHDGYADAWEKTGNLDPRFRRHALPQARHYIIQNRMLHVAKGRFLTATLDYSTTGTEPYTVLRSDNFYLTISMVHLPGQLPRKSTFRAENAEDNLFSRFEPIDERDNYAILTHIPSWDNKDPVHMAVLFPNGDYTGVYEAINLDPLIAFDLEVPEVPSETIDKPEPQLRKRIPKQDRRQA